MRLLMVMLVVLLMAGLYVFYSVLTIDRACAVDQDCVKSDGCGCMSAAEKCYFGTDVPVNDCICLNSQCQEEFIRGCRKAKEFCATEAKDALYDGKSCAEWLEQC